MLVLTGAYSQFSTQTRPCPYSLRDVAATTAPPFTGGAVGGADVASTSILPVLTCGRHRVEIPVSPPLMPTSLYQRSPLGCPWRPPAYSDSAPIQTTPLSARFEAKCLIQITPTLAPWEPQVRSKRPQFWPDFDSFGSGVPIELTSSSLRVS